MSAGKCVRCGEAIRFVIMAGAEHKVVPVDPAPDPLGRIIAERAGSRLIRGRRSPTTGRDALALRDVLGAPEAEDPEAPAGPLGPAPHLAPPPPRIGRRRRLTTWCP